MTFIEFLSKEFPYHNTLKGFGTVAHLFSKNGRYAVYSQEGKEHILSFQIAQGNWYFDLLEELEDEFGKPAKTYDHSGLTYYIWRTE